MPKIEPPTSVRSARVSAVRQLNDKSRRTKTGLALVEGKGPVKELLEFSPKSVQDFFVSQNFLDAHAEEIWLRDAVVVSDQIFRSMSDTSNPQGVIATAQIPSQELSELNTPKKVVILSNVRDPGNAGTILRSADAFDFDAVIFADDSVDAWSPKVIRSAVGSHWHLPIISGISTVDAVAWAHQNSLHVVATDLSGGEITNIKNISGVAWILGNEAWGLPKELADLADSRIRLKMSGRAESLNVASAATLAFYLTDQLL